MILDLEIFKKKLRRLGAVRQDAPYLRCRHKHIFRFVVRIEILDSGPVQQVPLRMGEADQVCKTTPVQLAPNGAPDQALVSRNRYPSVSRNAHAANVSISRKRCTAKK